MIILEAFSVRIVGSIARNARFGSSFCEIWRKHRAKRSFWKLVLWNLEEASHETIILEAFSVKIVGSIARNARFGSLFCEIWRKPRTKRSFWKLSVKSCGSLARNARFGSFFSTGVVRSSTGRTSFWRPFRGPYGFQTFVRCHSFDFQAKPHVFSTGWLMLWIWAEAVPCFWDSWILLGHFLGSLSTHGWSLAA